jgi:hypothetical protein
MNPRSMTPSLLYRRSYILLHRTTSITRSTRTLPPSSSSNCVISSCNTVSSASLSTATSYRKRYRPISVRIGWSQHVIEDLLPFTAEIITSKARPFENIAVGYCLPSKKPAVVVADDAGSDNDIIMKHVDESYLEIILPFADQPTLRESMMHSMTSTGNVHTGTLLYGRLFEVRKKKY